MIVCSATWNNDENFDLIPHRGHNTTIYYWADTNFDEIRECEIWKCSVENFTLLWHCTILSFISAQKSLYIWDVFSRARGKLSSGITNLCVCACVYKADSFSSIGGNARLTLHRIHRYRWEVSLLRSVSFANNKCMTDAFRSNVNVTVCCTIFFLSHFLFSFESFLRKSNVFFFLSQNGRVPAIWSNNWFSYRGISVKICQSPSVYPQKCTRFALRITRQNKRHISPEILTQAQW